VDDRTDLTAARELAESRLDALYRAQALGRIRSWFLDVDAGKVTELFWQSGETGPREAMYRFDQARHAGGGVRVRGQDDQPGRHRR
jgi:hypothetical protein